MVIYENTEIKLWTFKTCAYICNLYITPHHIRTHTALALVAKSRLQRAVASSAPLNPYACMVEQHNCIYCYVCVVPYLCGTLLHVLCAKRHTVCCSRGYTSRIHALMSQRKYIYRYETNTLGRNGLFNPNIRSAFIVPSGTAQRTPASTAQALAQILVCTRRSMWPRISLNALLLHRRPKSHSQRHIADSVTTKTEFRSLVDVPFAGAATTPSRISVRFFVWKETRKNRSICAGKAISSLEMLWAKLYARCALINLYKNTDAWPQRLLSNITATFPLSMFLLFFFVVFYRYPHHRIAKNTLVLASHWHFSEIIWFPEM